jgi:hypothetical protein
MKILLYTAITGGYEKPRTDIRVETLDLFKDPVRSARMHKCLTPDFSDYDYSIWMDGNTTLKVDPEYLIEKYLQNAPIACLQHPERDCIYKEAKTCQMHNLDATGTIQSQMERYKKENYPQDNGLSATTYILRKHTKEIDTFNRLWWSEICMGSRRDQLSFDYALWKLGINVQWFNFRHYDSHKINPYFNYWKHGKS